MMINDHMLIAAWIGAWVESRVSRLDQASEANDIVDRKEAQTTRDRANNFAQLRRLGHHRYRLWKSQLQVRRRGVVSVVSVYGPIEEVLASPEADDIGDGSVTQHQDDVVEPQPSQYSEQREVGSARVDELRSLQEAGEDQHEPPNVHDATLEKVELQVKGHQYELPQIPNASDEPPRNPDTSKPLQDEKNSSSGPGNLGRMRSTQLSAR